MNFFQLNFLLLLTIKLANGNMFMSFLSSFLLDTKSVIEIKNVKRLYSFIPPDSEICGRAVEIKTMETTFTCYEEVILEN